MRRNYIIRSFVVLCLFLGLFLGSVGTNKNIDVAGKTYVYTGEPFSKADGDLFTIKINEDGTFSYSESPFSSYLGFGEWSVKDGVLTLTDDEVFCIYRKNSFQIDGDDLIFIEDDSMNFIYIKVKDGERFTMSQADLG